MPNSYDFVGDYKGFFQKSSSQVYCDASGSLQYVGKTNHEVEVDMGTEYVEWFDNTSGTQSLYILITDKVDPRVNFSWMQVFDPNTLPIVYNLDSDISGGTYDYHFAGSDPNSLAEYTWVFASQSIYGLTMELWVREGICMANGSWTHGTPGDLSNVPCSIRATIDSTITDEKRNLMYFKIQKRSWS
jgi:hypothetical protein